MSGAGLTATPSSAQTTASTASVTPRAPSVRTSRLAVIAGRDRDAAGRRPQAARTGPAGRSAGGPASTGRARARRGSSARSRLVRREPLRSTRTSLRLLAQARHRRRGEPAAVAGSSASPGRSRASRTAVSSTAGRWPPRRSRAEFHRPAAPHRAELDERPVLVEDDEVDAVEEDRSHLGDDGLGRDGASSRAAPSTKQASGGNDTRDRRSRHPAATGAVR